MIKASDGSDQLKTLSKALQATDWKQRETAILDLLEVVKTHVHQFVGTNMNVFFDFVPRLSDANNKVGLAALKALNEMLPLVGSSMDTVMAEIMGGLAHNLASKSQPHREAAEANLESLVYGQDVSMVLPVLCSTITNANGVVQEGLIKWLNVVLERAVEDGKNVKLLNRYAISACAKLSTEKKLQPLMVTTWQSLNQAVDSEAILKHKSVVGSGVVEFVKGCCG